MSLSVRTLALAEQIGHALQQRGWQFTCAESCTGGGIAYAITAVAGSSNWFERAYVTYANRAKQDMVGVDPAFLQQYGAVSEPVVKQMAHGALIGADADVALAVSGIAGPGGGSPEKPVGTVWFGLLARDRIKTCLQTFAGDRQQIREQAIDYGLQLTLKLVQDHP